MGCEPLSQAEAEVVPRRLSVPLVLLLLPTVPPTWASSPDFLANSSFEVCTGCALDARRVPDQWTAISVTSTTFVSWTGDEVFDGNRSVLISDPSSERAISLRSRKEPAVPGAEYEAAVWLLRSSTLPLPGLFRLHVEFYTVAGATPLASSFADRVAHTLWQPIGVSAVAPQGTELVAIRIESDTSNEGEAFFDAASLVEDGALKPAVFFTSPAPGEMVKGVVNVQGTVDPRSAVPVRFVEVSVDLGPWQPADLQGTDWSLPWDTRALPNGPHTIHARAHNGRQFSELAARAAQALNPAPLVSMDLLPDPAKGSVTVTGASDANGGEPVQRVEVSVVPASRPLPGLFQPASGTTNWTFSWNTSPLDNGSYKVWARAWNGFRLGPAASRVTTVANPTPIVRIDSLPSLVGGIVPVAGTSAPGGPDPVQRVEVAFHPASVSTPSAWQLAAGTSSWSIAWDTRALADGPWRVWARAWNGLTFSPRVVVQTNVSNPAPLVAVTVIPAGPLDGTARFGGTATAQGADPIQSVQARVDSGAWMTAMGATSWTFDWDTSGVVDGMHTVSFRSTDGFKFSVEVGVGVVVRRFPDLAVNRTDIHMGYAALPVTVSASRIDLEKPYIDVVIRNRGGTVAAFHVTIADAEKVLCDFALPSMLAGFPALPSLRGLRCVLSRGTVPVQRVSVTADTLDQVPESAEGNNVASRIVVGAPNNGVLVWTLLDAVPETPAGA